MLFVLSSSDSNRIDDYEVSAAGNVDSVNVLLHTRNTYLIKADRD